MRFSLSLWHLVCFPTYSVPVLGAIGVGAFAWRDTHEIARTAIEIFSSDVTVEEAA